MGGDLITDYLANIMSELAGFVLLNESFEENPEFYDNFLTKTTLTLRLSILGFFRYHKSQRKVDSEYFF